MHFLLYGAKFLHKSESKEEAQEKHKRKKLPKEKTSFRFDDCFLNKVVEESSFEKNKRAQLIKVIDALGRGTTNKGLNIQIYNDGSVEKKCFIK